MSSKGRGVLGMLACLAGRTGPSIICNANLQGKYARLLESDLPTHRDVKRLADG